MPHMSTITENRSFFSSVCVERCGGVCCDPWWGIISYSMVKEGGLANLTSLRAEVVKGIRERARRILDAYVTNESPARQLFKSPEKYNVVVKEIRASGNTLNINLIAMFAFRCLFLSDKKACSIHPSILGREIRPPHCGFLGTPNAMPGERGYCRIIHAAEANDLALIDKAVDGEKITSDRSFNSGVDTIEEAADRVVEAVKAYCSDHAPHLLAQEKSSAPGRNDPCWCGSGKKFKKCHG